jgi:hypothetical protein
MCGMGWDGIGDEMRKVRKAWEGLGPGPWTREESGVSCMYVCILSYKPVSKLATIA